MKPQLDHIKSKLDFTSLYLDESSFVKTLTELAATGSNSGVNMLNNSQKYSVQE